MVNSEIRLELIKINKEMDRLATDIQKITLESPHYSSRDSHLFIIKKLELAQELLCLKI